MNTPAPLAAEAQDAWLDANQGLLTAEFARLKRLLRGEPDADGDIQGSRAWRAAPAAIDVLAERFALSPFERGVLLLAAGVEMDGELAPLCCAAGPGQPWASFALALAVLPDAHWSALTPHAPLRRWRLLDTVGDGALLTARLQIDERVLHYLAGIDELDARLRPLLRELPPPPLMAASQHALAEHIAAELHGDAPWPVVVLDGPDLPGKRDVAARLAAGLGLGLYALAADDIPFDLTELDALATLWQREIALQNAALLIEADAPPPRAALRFLQRIGGLALLATPEPVALVRSSLHHPVAHPAPEDQLQLWQQALGAPAAARLGPALDTTAGEFRLSAADIRASAPQLAHQLPGSTDPASALRQACRSRRRLQLGGLAQPIEALAGWSDLILPDAPRQLLREIATQVRHQLTVCERWGFARKSARGLGIPALFAGESGTGKTMAAEVLARELGLDLFRIDLSAVVSKYIGETEKNLARLFDAAEDSGAILLFDEADALFGKRSEVRDSHDRYANIEVSYLLQRMEAYRGLAILTTNQKAALDSAFQRRLRFVVNFPFPDLAEREAIWRSVFPAATPIEGLDYAKLARLGMTGGNIRNIALGAAFRAAGAGTPVTMAHLLRAAHSEAAKRDRAISEAETRGWT
ncbi:MAG: AAA family ATPase [Zoogloea sp.]|uniref:AAA family ATPase n=1 Tax=Zoogloea sp. TaxID=49181 RepID=UPI00262BCC1E|nr:AAA family ATPase [Zoogloea sp.]MDD3329135.1 AAA family ATPase [Zoogloea sp.]